MAGPEGIITLTFPASASSAEIITAINAEQDATGVRASAAALVGSPAVASGVVIQSVGYGSKNFVSVTEVNVPPTNAFNVFDRAGSDVDRTVGIDAVATINGVSSVADGLELKLSSRLLSLELILDTSYGTGKTSFAITSGGALFQLGPQAKP